MRSQIWELFYSVSQGGGFNSVCQRDPGSKAGKEGREGRGTGLDLIRNIWQKATSPHKEDREHEFLMSGGEGLRRAGEKAIDRGYFS